MRPESTHCPHPSYYRPPTDFTPFSEPRMDYQCIRCWQATAKAWLIRLGSPRQAREKCLRMKPRKVCNVVRLRRGFYAKAQSCQGAKSYQYRCCAIAPRFLEFFRFSRSTSSSCFAAWRLGGLARQHEPDRQVGAARPGLLWVQAAGGAFPSGRRLFRRFPGRSRLASRPQALQWMV